MRKQKTLRRLAYETRRLAEKRERQVEKARSRLYGDLEPNHSGKKAKISRYQKNTTRRRHRDRIDAKDNEESLGEEIEGAGTIGFDPGLEIGGGPRAFASGAVRFYPDRVSAITAWKRDLAAGWPSGQWSLEPGVNYPSEKSGGK